MGIDHLRLSPELVAALYPETLVAPDLPGSLSRGGPPVLEKTDIYPHWGENRRSLLFLVSFPDHEFLPPEQLVFIEKILAACKYKPEDIAILNTARVPVVFGALKQPFHPQVIFLWGMPASRLDMQGIFPDFVPTPFDGVQVVSVPTPEWMHSPSPQGQELKQRLWACLKKLFSL